MESKSGMLIKTASVNLFCTANNYLTTYHSQVEKHVIKRFVHETKTD